MRYVGNESVTYERKNARGYKVFEVLPNCNMANVDMVDIGDKIIIQPSESSESDSYVVLCDEFAVFGKNLGIEAEVEIILISGGKMLVTLNRGAIIIKTGDTLATLSMEGDEYTSSFSYDPAEIMWLNSASILDYGKYWKSISDFMYDFIITLEVSGCPATGTSVHIDYNKCYDISLGAYQVYLDKEEVRRCEEDRIHTAKMIQESYGSNMGMQLDDYPEDDEYYEDEDEDEYD